MLSWAQIPTPDTDLADLQICALPCGEGEGAVQDVSNDNPIPVKKFASVSLEKRFVLPILKAEEAGDRRLVTGPVLIPDTQDAQKHEVSAAEIEQAAHKFLLEYNEQTQIAYMHKDFQRKLALVESWIAPIDFELNGRSVVKGTWIVTVLVLDDDTWAAVKKGEIRGFSIGGTAFVEDLPET